MKQCRKCGQEKPLDGFNLETAARRHRGDGRRSVCRVCTQARAKERYWGDEGYRSKYKRYKKTLAEKIRACPDRQGALYNYRRDYNLKKSFGINHDDYSRMLAAQGNCCALCGGSEPGGKHARFVVDHDHKTRQIRGVLCNPCNVRLGSYEKLDREVGLDKVKAYIDGWPQRGADCG